MAAIKNVPSSTELSESRCLRSVTVEVAGSTFLLNLPSAKQQAEKASGLHPTRRCDANAHKVFYRPPPKHLLFFSDLPEHPVRKEWTALENGVHGREKIMGIHFVHVPVMGPRFVVVRQQKSHCLELTTPFHPHLNVEGAHLD